MAADANDNRSIAARLAAALIVRLPSDGCSAAQAVHLFNEVLDELGKPPATKATQPPSHFYESGNGDVWSLIYDNAGHPSVMHKPNPASGGKASCIDVDQFLRQSSGNPQHQALQRLMMGAAVDAVAT